jgi:hypothetical protein
MPLMQPAVVPSAYRSRPATKPIRWVRVLAAALALSVASTSAALLIRVGQLETAADQAMVDSAPPRTRVWRT